MKHCKLVVLRIEAENEEKLDIEIKNLKHLFDVHNEFNWEKNYIVKIGKLYIKDLKRNNINPLKDLLKNDPAVSFKKY